MCVCEPSVCLWRKVFLGLFPLFDWLFVFLVLSCMSYLYILEINPLSVASFAIIFSHFEGCLFTLLVGRFWVLFLSHSAPGFQLWFYFHLCIWVVHLGLLLRLPWRTWVCPSEGQVWRWCSCLGHRDSGSTRYSGSWRLGQKEI